MASRQVRKLLKKKDDLEALAADVSSDEDDTKPAAAPFNPFDLLSDEDEAAPEAVEQEEDNDEDDNNTQTVTPVTQKSGTTGGSKKKAAKNKKKKKGKGKAPAAAEDDDDDETQGVAGQEDEDIDKLVQELNLTTVGDDAHQSSQGNAASGPAVPTTSQLLAVDVQALRGDEELRRIFGASVIAAVDREETADAANRRRMAQTMRGQPGAAAALRRAKKGFLVTPKDHWPPLYSSLTMEYVGVEKGVQVFRYVWPTAYRYFQNAFEECQASHDPNAIAALLQHAPYHVDSLLAMYDLYRHLGENGYAEEVLHRSLHALEMAWHPQFDVKTANCRLDFEVEENRGLFLALFKHVQGLSRSGCHRTAWEVAKMLLALEPEDPMGLLCMMDYLAIKAGKYDYLNQFVTGWDADTSLGLRPNFAYGLAMAAFKLEQQETDNASRSQSQNADGGRLPSRKQLLHAILLHPSVVPKILSKLQDKGAGRESHWTHLLARTLFKKPHDASNASLQHLSNIYAEKSALLWKAPDLLELLRDVATRAADMHEAGSIKRSGTTQTSAEEDSEALTPQDWACVRQEAFPDDAQANEFRHLRLADFSDNVNALPREELGGQIAAPPDAAAAAAAARARAPRRGQRQGGNAGGIDMEDVDPAVLEEIQQQMAMLQQQQGGAQAGAAGAGPAMSEEELRSANPFSMLLRSMLPWVNAGQQPEYGTDQDQQQQPPQGQ